MPAIDRSLSDCIYMPAIDRSLSDCRYMTESTQAGGVLVREGVAMDTKGKRRKR